MMVDSLLIGISVEDTAFPQLGEEGVKNYHLREQINLNLQLK